MEEKIKQKAQKNHFKRFVILLAIVLVIAIISLLFYASETPPTTSNSLFPASINTQEINNSGEAIEVIPGILSGSGPLGISWIFWIIFLIIFKRVVFPQRR